MKPSAAPFLSLVFSFLNEEEVLAELVRRVRAVMNDLQKQGVIRGCELVFVNDASTDSSLVVLHGLALDHNDIRIVNLSRTFGPARGVMAGLAYTSGDLIIYMDADLQDPPEVIPEMLKAWQQGEDVDVVHTVRRSRQEQSPLKMFLTRTGYWVLNRYSTVPIPKEAGDFKLLTRRVVNHLIELKEYNPFMRGLICWVGFKQIFVPYDRAARYAGKSKFFILHKKTISNFLTSAVVNFSSVPLQVASYCGLVAIVVDIGVLVHALWQKFSGHAVPGWTAIMIVILFISSIQLWCLGMIGLYLNSVHEAGKHRPNYIVASTYGFKGGVA